MVGLGGKKLEAERGCSSFEDVLNVHGRQPASSSGPSPLPFVVSS
jgi:hypothetical protein